MMAGKEADESARYPGAPLWVRVFGGIAAVIAVLYVAAHAVRHIGGHASVHQHTGASSHASQGTPP
jgi:hypothetical protein